MRASPAGSRGGEMVCVHTIDIDFPLHRARAYTVSGRGHKPGFSEWNAGADCRGPGAPTCYRDCVLNIDP
jgi:hypothetical protein